MDAVRALADLDGREYGPADLGPAVPAPERILCLGLNYQEHALEGGREVPTWPDAFVRGRDSVLGPYADLVKPALTDRFDYEGELGIVIGRRCRHVPLARALEVVAGYLVVNDITVRDWQLRSPTMTMGKSFDTHGPIGPWLVTADEIPDPQALGIRTWVNGALLQDGSTRDMVYSCAQQIEHLSTAFTLEPGDIISTGTPEGIGPIKAGDTVKVKVDGVGELVNPVEDDS